jgi:glutathione S-transferase
MACEEKGIAYERLDAMPHSPEILPYNPTGKMPGFQHRDLILWETSAITRYLDETFPGASLQPADPIARTDELLDQHGERRLLPDHGPRHHPAALRHPRGGRGQDPAVGREARDVQLADQTLEKTPYLAGEQLTLADLFLAPILFWLEKTPEAQAALPKYDALARWYKAISQRQSFQATIPPMPGQRAA